MFLLIKSKKNLHMLKKSSTFACLFLLKSNLQHYIRYIIRGVRGVAIATLLLLFICPMLQAKEKNHSGNYARVMTEVPFIAVRTNLPYDAFLVPNIGVEFWLPMNFTIGADWFGTWFTFDQQHIYWQGYGGYLTARYYFGKLAEQHPFLGHHVGIYGSILTYDIELGGKGYQAAKPGFGGGIEYGYSLPVNHYLCFDFTLGVGYQGGEYKSYQPTDDGTGHYVWEKTYRRHWWGPTKVEASMKFLIGALKRRGGHR